MSTLPLIGRERTEKLSKRDRDDLVNAQRLAEQSAVLFTATAGALHDAQQGFTASAGKHRENIERLRAVQNELRVRYAGANIAEVSFDLLKGEIRWNPTKTVGTPPSPSTPIT